MCRWCRKVFTWIEKSFLTPVFNWVSRTISRCSRQRCNWWCLCCNKWLCWIFTILLAIVTIIIAIIMYLIMIILCGACALLCVLFCVVAYILGKIKDLDRCFNWCSGKEPSPGDVSPIETPPIHVDIPPVDTGPEDITVTPTPHIHTDISPLDTDSGKSLPETIWPDKKWLISKTPSTWYRRNSLSIPLMETGSIRVTDASQLERLAPWKSLIARPCRIVLDLPGMNKEELAEWQSLINRPLSACGCQEGAAMMSVFAIGYLLYLMTSTHASFVLDWILVGKGLCVAFSGALLGKLGGLTFSQMRLAQHVRQLKLKIAEGIPQGQIVK